MPGGGGHTHILYEYVDIVDILSHIFLIISYDKKNLFKFRQFIRSVVNFKKMEISISIFN